MIKKIPKNQSKLGIFLPKLGLILIKIKSFLSLPKSRFMLSFMGVMYVILQSSMGFAKETVHGEFMTGKTFEVIEQPLSVKVLMTVGGLTLIGLELWWFLGSQSKSKRH